MPTETPMDARGVQVRFAIELDAQHLLEEGDPALASWPAGRLGLDDLVGEWRLAGGSLPQAVAVADDLLNLGHELGLGGARAVAAGEAHEFLFEQSAGSLRLEPSGQETNLIVRGELLGTLPSAALAPALRSCAARLAEALARLAGDDEGLHAAARDLARRAAADGV